MTFREFQTILESKFHCYGIYIIEPNRVYKATFPHKQIQIWYNQYSCWVLRKANGKKEHKDLDYLIQNPP
jgi:hypothetical protein